MWMCDGCQEINDDNVTACTRCGRPFEPEVLPPAHPGQRGEDQLAPTILTPSLPRTRPNKLLLYGSYLLCGLVSFAPLVFDRNRIEIHALICAVSTGFLGVAAFHLWRDIDLLLRGVQTEGKAISIDFFPSYNRYGNQMGGRYFTNATYMVGDVPYIIRSEYGTMTQNEFVGAPVTIWYDRGAPEIAVLGERAKYQTFVILIRGLVFCYLAYEPNTFFFL